MTYDTFILTNCLYRLQPANRLLQTPPFSEEFSLELLDSLEKACLLYVVEVASRISDIMPALPHMRKWKDWVIQTASDFTEGRRHLLLPHSQELAHLERHPRM